MLAEFINDVKPAVDAELRLAIAYPNFSNYPGLDTILMYHLGFGRDGGNDVDQGKKIRSLLVLLAANAVGADWRRALPSAAAVELLHNFSLIHDDIEDRGELRRGRAAVWKKWGEPLAINAGDALYALSFAELNKLERSVSLEAAFRSTQVLIDTCLQLTGGQHLDISFEKQTILPIASYWEMISGKTAALLSACLRLGAIAGNAPFEIENHLAKFGLFLGLSFQVWDDWLGIWGNAEQTGKPGESDLVLRKKTLPVVHALERDERFARRWLEGPITTGDIPELTNWLIDDGAQAFTEAQADRLTQEAIQSLRAAISNKTRQNMLEELALSLLKRNK